VEVSEAIGVVEGVTGAWVGVRVEVEVSVGKGVRVGMGGT